jgi:hypothetical protein
LEGKTEAEQEKIIIEAIKKEHEERLRWAGKEIVIK